MDGKPIVIHQIFLDVGLKPLSERPEWLENIKENKRLNPNCEHILWDDEKVELLISELDEVSKEMIKSFENKFYLIDFIRYHILLKYGGIYIDCDVCCKKSIENIDYICGSIVNKYNKDNTEWINNNVIKFNTKKEYEDLLNFCISEYKRIKDNNLYALWGGRRFLNSMGASMFKRFCIKNKIKSDIIFKDYFWDEQGNSWIPICCKKEYEPNKIRYGSKKYNQ